MTTEVALQHAFLEKGLARVAWWNGRVLTADDLRDHQVATDTADRRLGRAIGAGVVEGLVVAATADRRSVEVSDGLAVAPAGEVLDLPLRVRVPLVPPEPEHGEASGPAGFVACAELPVSFTPAGHGIYLLTIASATGSSGAAAGADVRGIATRDCGPRYEVAGVQFRLVEVDLATLAGDRGHDEADVGVLAAVAGGGDPGPRLRNVAAAVLLDALPRRASIRDPFGTAAGARPVLDELRAAGRLTDCDVPLAVLTWQAGAIGLLDVWSVRRPPSPTWTAAGSWPDRSVGDTGVQAGLATLHQFTDHLAALVGPGVSAAARAALRAREVFRYLPPAVLLPEVGIGRPRGVSLDAFLTEVARRGGGLLAGGRLWPLLRASLTAPPVDLDAEEGLLTYTVAEAIGMEGAQPFTLLAADHLSHLAVAPEEELDRLVITGVSPAGDHPVSSQITIHGRNFGVPVGQNEVTIGGVPVSSFNLGTSSEALVCNVPQLAELPRIAPIVVSTGGQTAEWLLSVVAESVVPAGRLVFVEDLGDLADVDIEVREAPYLLWWRVTAVTTAPATFSFAPQVVDPEGASEDAWLEQARILDASGDELETVVLEPADVQAGQGAGTAIGLEVRVPIGAERVGLALRATCLDAPDVAGLNVPSAPVILEVGLAPEVGDDRIVFEPAAPGGGVHLLDGVMVFERGAMGAVVLTAQFRESGRFEVVGSIEPDDGGWVLDRLTPAEPVNGSPDDAQELFVSLQPTAAAVERQLRLRIEQIGDGESYSSSTTIPIRAVAQL